MSTPILATKLFVPEARPKRVLRSRLIERLDAGLQGDLTLVSAPAGFGKTTLVGGWAAGCERPVAWLSLDEGDNDLNRFLPYLVAALQTVAPELGAGVLELLASPPPVPTEPVLIALLNDIGALPEPVVLVLDDYHLIDTGAVDRVLAFLLERLPPQLHLVVLTREDPELPLARYRVRGRLNELRAADLRFTAGEAADFLQRVMGLDLPEAAVAALERRTEGWIAGLQLAAVSLQGREDAAGFVASFTGSHRFVLDYLVEEVLQRQPARVQDFLLRTSILERLCGPLCDAVLGGDGRAAASGAAAGQETLEYLERANLLVVPLDDQRRWYRYHHLFADVLQTRLTQERPDPSPGLHRRACAWYQQHEAPAAAIRHALAAADFERAADLIELEWSVVRRSCFRSPTWLGWVRALPDEIVRRRPVLCVGYASELLNVGELEAADARLRDAERWLGADGEERGAARESDEMVVANEREFSSLGASLATARGFHAQARGDVSAVVDHARRALALAPETDHYIHGMARSLLGLGLWTRGELEPAAAAIAAARERLRRAGNVLFAVSTAFVLADIQIELGRLREAVGTYRRALELATAQGVSALQGTADLHLGLAELHHQQGDDEAAARHLRASEELGEGLALPYWAYRLRLARARFAASRGDLDVALARLDEAAGVRHVEPFPDVRPLEAMRARVWIRQGRLREAMAWARERELSVDDELAYLREFEHLTLARLLLARSGNGVDGASEPAGFLERLQRAAEAGGRTGSVIEILLLRALSLQARGEVDHALEPLERALALAEPQGYARIFVDEGKSMERLLSAARARGVWPEYVGGLLAVFAAGSGLPAATQVLDEPLSARELEVLRLVAQGLTNQEIGERLFRALSTIKGHNRNIFGKLQVRSRTEAVARARELGLL